MAHGPGGDHKTPQILLHALCSRITGLKDDALTPYYKIALNTLGSTVAVPSAGDEFAVSERIKKKLVRQHREQDAAVFSELHRKLQSQDALKNRWAILYFLVKLSDHGDKNTKPKCSTAFIQGLSGHPTSTPFARHTPAVLPRTGQSSIQSAGSGSTSGIASSISSIHASGRSLGPSPTPQSLPPGFLPSYQQQYTGTVGKFGYDSVSQSIDVTRKNRSMLPQGTGRRKKIDDENTNFEVPEVLLLREVVYIFQGIESKSIHMEMARDGFHIDPKVGIPLSMRKTITKLAECGWLYSKVRKYSDARSADRAFGLVGQSFCAALHQELNEYYRLMAVLEAQLQQEEDLGVSLDGGGMTLRRLSVWTCDPLVRLKSLAALVDVCQGKKGGALATAIHSYIQHGDPSIQALVRHILTLVAQPIFNTILRWIYDGELEDTFHEFFVASDPTVKDDQLWHEKYTLRKSMIPSFLTMDQAKKILLTGKSINFLRQVCQDRTMIRNMDVVKAAETHQVESIFNQDLDGIFANMIDTVYKETSQHLLHVLHVKYKFMEHLKAMRRYLLLGQGDFIRHLMDLLEEDLAKPAGTLYLHNLTGILETAIRATNAQYDDSDILKRVDVRMLEVSPGDTGWDVFSLDYHVDGPIRTVFTTECMIKYLRVFNFLWRAKRMEYTLAGIWKGQMANAKLLRTIPELAPLLHQCHVIGSEMVHFVQQVQYYINFEVLECSWDELLKNVQEAEDLDHILVAHQHFLTTIISRSLLDTQSSGILTQLRTIFDLIIQFQAIQDTMYQAASDELHARQVYEENLIANTEQGQWGLTDEDQTIEQDRRLEFGNDVLPTTRSQLRVLAQSYQNMVQQFLIMLTNHSDINLRFLSFRLDFNEHYRAKEPKLRSPLAYHKVKQSSMSYGSAH